MGTMTLAEIMQSLDDLLSEDTPGLSPWSLERKHRAINRAVRSAWPNLKIAQENARAVVLSTATYKYSLADIDDIGDLGNGVGVCQVLVERRSECQDWVPLRTVTQSQDGDKWYLHVPEGIVEGNVGRKLKLRYYARVPEFTSEEFSHGCGTLAREFANYVVYAAAVDLIGWSAQDANGREVQDLLKLIPLYTARALTELKANTVNCMPILVEGRSEG